MALDVRQSDRDHIQWLNKLNFDWSKKVAVDLGCGSGYLPQYLVERGAQKVLGIDLVQPDGLQESQQLCFRSLDLQSADWVQQAEQTLMTQPHIVLAFDILEHLTSPFQLLKDCHALLRPGGKLVLTTPNVNSWERLLRPQNWSGARDSQHKILFTKYSLSFLAAKTGFILEQASAPVRAAGPFARYLPDIGGQLLLTCQKRSREKTS